MNFKQMTQSITIFFVITSHRARRRAALATLQLFQTPRLCILYSSCFTKKQYKTISFLKPILQATESLQIACIT